MKIKYSAIALIAFVLAAFTGCEELGNLMTQDDGVTVGLRVDGVGQDVAHIRLTHNGSAEDYWFCMNTTNLDAEARDVLERTLSDIVREEGEIEARTGVNRNVTFKGLAAKTTYRAIASRIDAYGNIVGNVADLKYATMRDPAVFEERGDWNMTYLKREQSEDDPDVENDVFRCDVSDTTETFVPVIISKSDFADAYGNLNDEQTRSAAVRSCFEDYVEYRNSEHAKWSKLISNKDCSYSQERLRSGDYWLFMMGITRDGELTGYYSCDDHLMEQEPMLAAYQDWLGTYTVTEETPSSQPLEYQVTIEAEENNLYMRMKGWEQTAKLPSELSTVPQGCPILLYFEKSTGDVYVVSEDLQNIETDAAGVYDFFVYGLVYMDETLSLIDLPNLRLARLSLKDKVVTATPERFTYVEDGKAKSSEFDSFCYVYTTVIWPQLTPLTEDVKVIRISNMKMTKL